LLTWFCGCGRWFKMTGLATSVVRGMRKMARHAHGKAHGRNKPSIVQALSVQNLTIL